VNLNYLNPADVDIAAYQADPDTFVEPHAGEVLYRLGSPQTDNRIGESDGREPDLAGLEG
jgi:lactate racemase